MQKALPIVLQQEPLVDAVFEVRLKGTQPLSDILPGFLHAKLEEDTAVVRLPAAEIPHPMRAQDPNLKYQPTLRLELEKYFISVGDQSIAISCKLPYPKWAKFKAEILEIMQHIKEMNIAGQIERYSVKYVNLIQAPTLAEQIQKISMNIQIGDIQVGSDRMSLQVHREEGNIVHIISVLTGAEGQMSQGERVQGTIVDIDSIRTINAPDFSVFVADLDQGVEELRQENKKYFFNCLTQSTIDEMGPEYE